MRRIVLDTNELELCLERLACQLIENHTDFEHTILVGLQPRGKYLCEKIIKILNKKFLNKNSSTDVLAFPTTQNWSKGIRNSNDKDNFNDEGHLGDIFISFENIVIQSKLYMTGADLELNIILAHGILHLLGLSLIHI